MLTVYIVMSSRGDWDMYEERQIRAFASPTRAAEFMERAENLAAALDSNIKGTEVDEAALKGDSYFLTEVLFEPEF